jgi:RNA polymerase sigma factor (sigma-70 family)
VSLPPFDQLVTEHGAVVLRVCRALLGPVDADDAWSETFLSALRAYPDLRPDSNVRGWLVTIAHRKALDQLRAAKRAPQPTGDVPEVATTRGIPGEQIGVLPADELRDSLAALPFKQRSAVVLHHLAGMPYAEVAAEIDSSEAAARRSAADGIAALRRTHPQPARQRPAHPRGAPR